MMNIYQLSITTAIRTLLNLPGTGEASYFGSNRIWSFLWEKKKKKSNSGKNYECSGFFKRRRS